MKNAGSQPKNIGRAILLVLFFGIGLYIGEPIKDFFNNQTLAGYELSNAIQFTFGYFSGILVTKLIPWETS